MSVPTRSTAETRQRGREITLARKSAFTFLFVAVVLVTCEAAVRLRGWIRYGTTRVGIFDAMLVDDPATGLLIPRPGYVQHSGRIDIKINSLGFRGEEITVEKPPHTIRIATIGASTTFCGEVTRNEATWPHQLQEAIQRAHPELGVQVINAGIPGYVVSESRTNLRERVLRLRPDIVIYYEANNDLVLDTQALAKQRGLIPDAEPSMARTLAKHSLLFDLVRKNGRILFASRDVTSGKLEGLPQDLPARYIGELDKMHRDLSDRGTQMVMSSFFVKYRRNQPRDTQIKNASTAFYYMPWMTMDGLLNGNELYNKAIIAYARSHDVPVAEDNDSIPGDDVHFVDWTHLSDAGARAMAERFSRFFERHELVQGAIHRLH